MGRAFHAGSAEPQNAEHKDTSLHISFAPLINALGTVHGDLNLRNDWTQVSKFDILEMKLEDFFCSFSVPALAPIARRIWNNSLYLLACARHRWTQNSWLSPRSTSATA